jgi:hypothetical protein
MVLPAMAKLCPLGAFNHCMGDEQKNQERAAARGKKMSSGEDIFSSFHDGALPDQPALHRQAAR